jgi:hypothetical protein
MRINLSIRLDAENSEESIWALLFPVIFWIWIDMVESFCVVFICFLFLFRSLVDFGTNLADKECVLFV